MGCILWCEVVGESGRCRLVFVKRGDWGERPLLAGFCGARWVGENGRCWLGGVVRGGWRERPFKLKLIVMTTYGKNINIVIIKLVDKSIFLRDTP